MMAVSDGVVIGIVLGLIFAAVSYYLHTRMTQLEKKVGYIEGILLDLKVTTEQAILSASESHESGFRHVSSESNDESANLNDVQQTYTPIQENDAHGATKEQTEQPSRIRPPTPEQGVPTQSTSTSVSNNYEAMTYKELQQVARQRNISGIRNLSKAQVIEIIRSHDNGTSSPSTHTSPVPLTSWKSDEGSQGTSLEHLSSSGLDESNGLAPIREFPTSEEPELALVGSE
jgi:hypothetical protein